MSERWITELAASGGGIVRRPRRSLAGEGMLRCRRTFRYDGQTFYARETKFARVAPDHPAASPFPENFRPAVPNDEDVRVRAWVARHKEKETFGVGGTIPLRGERGPNTPSWYLP